MLENSKLRLNSSAMRVDCVSGRFPYNLPKLRSQTGLPFLEEPILDD